MSRTLRFFLVALVLVNLAFVNATEAANYVWLGPLYLLTLASPILVRWQESRIYRALWNLAVMGLFALLVQHATTSARMEYLLEDGLRLAAICQVHLLNNLGKRQRPDLLFFNSFLIALVTAFLTWDVAYSAIFLAYVPVLVIGMAVHCVAPPGSPPVPREILRRVVGDGLRRSAVALVVTGLLFFLVPRDFHRKGLLGDRFDLSGDSASMELGFTEQVKIKRTGSLEVSDAEVMRVALVDGDRLAVPAHFRGATFLHFDGSEWRPGPPGARDRPWAVAKSGVWTRRGERHGATIHGAFVDRNAGRVFLPLSVNHLQFLNIADPVLASPVRDGTVKFDGDDVGPDAPLLFRARLHADSRTPSGTRRAPRNHEDRHLVALQPGTVPALLTRRARELGADLERGVDQDVIVQRYASYLRDELAYLPPGDDGAAETLEDFLMGEGGGHCEVFATTLALMLRTRRIPCRLVTGYLTDEWDDETDQLILRRRHAHAWVEVLDPSAGWYTVDPTPALSVMQSRGGLSWMSAFRREAHRIWSEIITFDDKSRAEVYAWFRALPGRMALALRDNPLAVFGLLLCLGVWFMIRRRMRIREPAEVVSYRKAVKRSKLVPRVGETPRELLSRARMASVPEDRVRALESATLAHERARFAAPCVVA